MTAVLAPARPSVRRSGPSLAALVWLEVRKSLSTRSGLVLAVVGALLAPAGIAFVAASSSDAVGSVTGPLGVVGMLTGMVLIALGVLSTAGEWSHGTAQTTFLLVPRRGRVLAAKAAAVALIGAVLAAVAVALSAGVVAVLADGAVWDGLGRVLVVDVVAGAAFAVIGAGVGAALANTPGSLTGLYLVVLGVLPVLRSFKPVLVQHIDPTEAVLNLAQGSHQTLSITILAVWVAVATVAGAVMTRRRAVQ
jgi:ABC-2 type transport system permease protein